MDSVDPVIIIIADGWTQALFGECLEDSLLPEIQSELVSRGTFYKNVISVFPSVSLASHTTLITSQNPSLHGIPGHRWLQQDNGRKRSYIGWGAGRVNVDMSSTSMTIFEKFSSHNTAAIQCAVTRGAKKIVRMPTMNSAKLLSETADLVCHRPDSLVSVWLPRGDVISHTHGPRSKAVVREMIETSRGIGILMKKLSSAGLASRAKIVFTSDHGQKQVDKICHLDKHVRSQGYSCSINVRNGAKTDFAIYTNGDASAFLYTTSQSISKDEKLLVLERLVEAEGVDLAFLRYDDFTHYIISRQGLARVSERSSLMIEYTVERGVSPLGNQYADDGSLIDLSETSPDCGDYEYPDLIHQYLTSFVRDRSADMLVSSSPGFHFGVAPRLAWRLGYHRGSHGGPSRQEMVFSAIAVGCGNPGLVSSPLRSKDLLTRTILK